MAVFNFYTIFDKVANEYAPVFQAVNDGVALRSVKKILSDVDDASDYQVFRVGTFDSGSGFVDGCSPIEVTVEDFGDYEAGLQLDAKRIEMEAKVK